jgi:hypothetical protein
MSYIESRQGLGSGQVEPPHNHAQLLDFHLILLGRSDFQKVMIQSGEAIPCLRQECDNEGEADGEDRRLILGWEDEG